MRLRHVYQSGGRRLIFLAAGVAAAQPKRRAGAAVVRAPAADDLVSALDAHAVVIGAGDLDGRLDGLGAAADREDPGQGARGELGDLLGEPYRRLGGRPLREEGELLHLLVGGFGDLGPAVADVDGRVAAVHVDPRLAGGVYDLDPVAADNHVRAALFRHLSPVASGGPQVLRRRALDGIGIDDHWPAPCRMLVSTGPDRGPRRHRTPAHRRAQAFVGLVTVHVWSELCAPLDTRR